MDIKVIDRIGENAITLDDGLIVYEAIHSTLKDGQQVNLDFEGVRLFASPFLNASIGQLLRDIEPESLNQNLIILNLNPVARSILRRVIENAKLYYNDEQFRKTIDEVIESESKASYDDED